MPQLRAYRRELALIDPSAAGGPGLKGTLVVQWSQNTLPSARPRHARWLCDQSKSLNLQRCLFRSGCGRTPKRSHPPALGLRLDCGVVQGPMREPNPLREKARMDRSGGAIVLGLILDKSSSTMLCDTYSWVLLFPQEKER